MTVSPWAIAAGEEAAIEANGQLAAAQATAGESRAGVRLLPIVDRVEGHGAEAVADRLLRARVDAAHGDLSQSKNDIL
jgi:hypothetical protein